MFFEIRHRPDLIFKSPKLDYPRKVIQIRVPIWFRVFFHILWRPAHLLIEATLTPTMYFSASIKVQHENDKHEMEEKFRERLYQVSEEFSAELTTNKEELQARHKKQLGNCHG